MPIISKNLPSLRLLARPFLQDHHCKAVVMGSSPGQVALMSLQRDWPSREEAFAAQQLVRQNQQSRSWSNRDVRVDANDMLSSVTRMDHAAPRRMKVMSAQNAAMRRIGKESSSFADMDTDVQDHRQRKHPSWRSHDGQHNYVEEHSEGVRAENMQAGGDPEAESDLVCRSVRETLFGSPESNEEEERERARSDEELRLRVVAQNRQSPLTSSISSKVISPYNSYRVHRTRWAEFRHGMVYGRSAY
ncbi:hypothetical protein KR009_010250 [Drosophila setifemur]|nr:hypothetical protein KR009_010250 [Drosophila setifemur]